MTDRTVALKFNQDERDSNFSDSLDHLCKGSSNSIENTQGIPGATERASQGSSRTLLQHICELVSSPPEWIIKDILPTESLSVLFGESGTGKSFLALDLCLSIARGSEWHGHHVDRAGAVIYICGEGASGVKRR